ncbi:MAG: hypothetical protein ABGX49_03590, partial [Candidatus Poseidoniia archaeon]
MVAMPSASVRAGGNLFITGHDVLNHHGQCGFDERVLDYLRCAGTVDEIAKCDYSVAILGSYPGDVNSTSCDSNGITGNRWGWSVNYGSPGNPDLPDCSNCDGMVFDPLAANCDPGCGTNICIDCPVGTGNPACNGNQDHPCYDIRYFNTYALTAGSSLWTDVLSRDLLIVLSHESVQPNSSACYSGGLNNDGVVEIKSMTNAIRTAFNNGMDIWVNSNLCDPEYYDFIPSIEPILNGPTALNCDFQSTPAGGPGGMGLEDHMMNNACVGNCTHTYFTNWDASLIDVMEYNTTISPGLGEMGYDSTGDGALDSVAISLGAKNIEFELIDVCANIDEDTETIFCIPVEQGSYQYSIDIINKSDFEVVKMLIPDVTDVNGAVLVDVEPNVVDYSPTTYGTGEALPTLELTLNPVPGSGYEAGDFIPLMIGLMAKDDDGTIFQCCAIDREVELPVCCNELKNYYFGEFDSGCVELTLEFTNLDQMAPVEAFHAFLLGLSPASMTFDPDYFALPGGVLDNSTGTLTTTICGVSPGDTIEFELIIHSENLEECCNQVHTLVIPDGGPEPCIPELQCETVMEDGILQLRFTWLPPANDECCVDEEGNWRQAVLILDGNMVIISVPVTDLTVTVPCQPGEYCLWCGIATAGVLQACCTVDECI